MCINVSRIVTNFSVGRKTYLFQAALLPLSKRCAGGVATPERTGRALQHGDRFLLIQDGGASRQ